jgi:hypothetical protein
MMPSMRAMLLLSCVGCGASLPAPARESDLDIGAWVGDEPAIERVATAAAPIELDGGEAFRELLALSRADGPTPRCALYSIRMHEGALEEGQLNVACPSPPDAIPAADVPYAAVDGARETQLRRALRGAAIAAPSSDGPIVIRLLTDRRALEGRVPDPRWPEPYATAPEPGRETPPASLAELWEALMYPERYAGR